MSTLSDNLSFDSIDTTGNTAKTTSIDGHTAARSLESIITDQGNPSQDPTTETEHAAPSDYSVDNEADVTSNDNESLISNTHSNSELRDYESFLSEERHQDTTEDESVLIQKAVTYPVDTDGKGSNIGAREEKDVIDNLRHENFQLKLRIVVIESQLNQASGEGVAELRKQLAEAQASKIAVQHENSKIRKTLSELTKDRENENDQYKAATDLEMKTLEENLLYYQEELQVLRHHCEELEQSSLDREAQYEEALRKEKMRSRSLQEQLRATGNSSRQSGSKRYFEGHNDYSGGMRRTLSDDSAAAAAASGLDIGALFNQAETIKRVLSSPRSRSQLSSTSNSLADFNNDSGGLEILSDLLKQVQDAASQQNIKFSALQREYDSLANEYEKLARSYENANENFEQVLADVKTEHENELYNYDHQIKIKDNQLERSQQELDSIWKQMGDVKTSLDELESLRFEAESLSKKLQNSEAENFKLKSNLNNKSLELEKTKNESEKLGSNFEDQSAQLIDTRKQLEDANSAHKSCLDEIAKLTSQLEAKDNNQLPEDVADMRVKCEKIDQILAIVQKSYNEKASPATLVEDLEKAFEIVAEVESTMAQVNETLSENGRLSNLLDSKDSELEDVKKQLDSLKASSEESLEQANDELTKLREKTDELSTNLERKANDNERLIGKLNDFERDNAKLQHDLDGLNAQLRERSEKFSSLKKKYEQQRSSGAKDSEIMNLKLDKSDLVAKLEQASRECEQLKKQKHEISSEAKSLQERLYYETSRNDALEKKMSSAGSRQSTRGGNMLGTLDVSQTFKQQTYERLNELQKTVDSLQLGRNNDSETIRTLEKRLFELRDKSSNTYITILQKLCPWLNKDWAKRIESLVNNGASNAAHSSERIGTLERTTKEAIDSLLSEISQETKENQKVCSQLKEQLKATQQSQQETANQARYLQSQVNALQKNADSSQNKPKGAINDMTLKHAPSNGEVRKEIFKQISGSFVGKIWLSRYHEMEKRWHNERETRRREYDGYKQHLNECYERIESQKNSIRKLQARIKSSTGDSPE